MEEIWRESWADGTWKVAYGLGKALKLCLDKRGKTGVL